MLEIANIILKSLDHILVLKSFCCLHGCIAGEVSLLFTIRKSIVKQEVPKKVINCKAKDSSDSRLLFEKGDFIAIM